MNDTKSCVTVLYGIHKNTHRKKIINLINCFVLIDHLLINTEEMFDTSVYLSFDVGIFHVLLDFFDNGTDKRFSLTLTQCNFLNQIIVYIRF